MAARLRRLCVAGACRGCIRGSDDVAARSSVSAVSDAPARRSTAAAGRERTVTVCSRSGTSRGCRARSSPTRSISSTRTSSIRTGTRSPFPKPTCCRACSALRSGGRRRNPYATLNVVNITAFAAAYLCAWLLIGAVLPAMTDRRTSARSSSRSARTCSRIRRTCSCSGRPGCRSRC